MGSWKAASRVLPCRRPWCRSLRAFRSQICWRTQTRSVGPSSAAPLQRIIIIVTLFFFFFFFFFFSFSFFFFSFCIIIIILIHIIIGCSDAPLTLPCGLPSSPQGVRIYLAACFVQTLRISAPEAPYEEEAMKVCSTTENHSML